MPAAIYALAVGTFLMGTSEFVVAGLLTEVSTDFGVTVSQAGWAITVFAIGMILGAPATALLTLRVAQRTTLILALLIFAAGHILVAVTPDFPLMLAGRFISATATGAFWAVGCVAAAQIAGPAFSSKALGLVLGGGMLATVLGVPVGSFSGQLLGWRGTFWALAALAIGAVAAIATRLPQGRPDRTCTSVRAEIRALRNPQLWLVLITCVLINAGVMSIYSYISVLLTDGAGLPPWTTPLVLMLFGVLAFVGNIVGGRLGDHRPLTTALTAAGLTLIAAVGIAWTYQQPIALIVAFALLGLAGQSANPILVALAVRYGDRSPTLAGAMPTSLFNAGTAIGTSLTGALLTSGIGMLAPALVGSISAALVLIPLGWLFLKACDRGSTANQHSPGDRCGHSDSAGGHPGCGSAKPHHVPRESPRRGNQ